MQIKNRIIAICGAVAIVWLSAVVALTFAYDSGPTQANQSIVSAPGVSQIGQGQLTLAQRENEDDKQGGFGGGFTFNRDVYVLDTSSVLWRRRACAQRFRRVIAVRGLRGDERLIGIDFRPADNLLYGVTDRNNIYTIDVDPPGVGNLTLVSPLTVPFAGGFQSLADFNPVLSALRLIGSNGQNYAVVGATLNTTAPQTSITFAPGDVNAGRTAALTGGAYTNNDNDPATTNTIFYGLDFSAHVLVYIAPAVAGGSSATGGGQIQTIGALMFNGQRISITPLADMDIYTDGAINTLVGISGQWMFAVDLATVTIPPLGQQSPVSVQARRFDADSLIDIAIDTRPSQGSCGKVK